MNWLRPCCIVVLTCAVAVRAGGAALDEADVSLLRSRIVEALDRGDEVHLDVPFGRQTRRAELLDADDARASVLLPGPGGPDAPGVNASLGWNRIDARCVVQCALGVLEPHDVEGMLVALRVLKALGERNAGTDVLACLVQLDDEGVAAVAREIWDRGPAMPATVTRARERPPTRARLEPRRPSKLQRTSRVDTPHGSLLPQDHPYQKRLYRWLRTIAVEDVALPNERIAWDGSFRDEDHLSCLWATVASAPHYLTGTALLRLDAKWFVLDDGEGHGLVGSGAVVHPRWGNAGAFYYWLDLPLRGGGNGNPYHRHRGLALRALATTAVDMMMTDRMHASGKKARNDYLGGTMNGWIYAYEVCRDELDDESRAAFEQGFERFLDKILKWGPNNVCTNMDMRSVAAAGRLYGCTESLRIRDKAVRAIRKLIFRKEDGSVTDYKAGGPFYPAGYIGEKRGPETTYNGVSLYHILEARAGAPDDEALSFLDEVLERMLSFQFHQWLPDHAGYVDGPIGYANRTGNSYVYVQRMRAWAQYAAADLCVAGRPYAFGRGRRKGIPDEPTMVASVRSRIAYLNGRGNLGSALEGAPKPWASNHAHHWPPDTPFFAARGWHARLAELARRDDPTTYAPFYRAGEEFSTFFGERDAKEFWAYRAPDGRGSFGFFVEHVPRSWPFDSHAGGSLQAFWSTTTGILVLTGGDKGRNDWEHIDLWPTEHVWGRTAGGSFTTALFNSGMGRKLGTPKVTVDTGSNPSWVEVIGGFTGRKALVAGEVHSRYEAVEAGIRVTRAVRGAPPATRELWGTIPVFLRNARSQGGSKDTTVSYRAGERGAWTPLGTTLVATRSLRLGRDTGSGVAYGYVSFDRERDVRLSGSAWQASYQSRNRYRNIHVALRSGRDSVTYAITTHEPKGGAR